MVLRRAGHRHARGRELPPADGGHRAGGQFLDQGASSSTARTTRRGVVYPRGVHRRRSWSSASARSIYLIMDDIYHKLVFDGRRRAAVLPVHDEGPRGLAAHRRQRHREAVRHDRLPHRLVRRPAEDRRGDDQRAGADDLLRVAGDAGRRRGRADRPAERRRGAAADDPEQPRRDDAGAVVVQRREDVQARRHLLLPARLPRLQQQLGRAVELPAEEGAGRDRARHGVRHGGAPAAELRRHRQGRHRGHRAHQVGARPDLAQRDLHRRQEARSGTGYDQPARHQDARAGRRPRRSRATTGWTTTASATSAAVYWNLPDRGAVRGDRLPPRGHDHPRRRRSW